MPDPVLSAGDTLVTGTRPLSATDLWSGRLNLILVWTQHVAIYQVLFCVIPLSSQQCMVRRSISWPPLS